MITITRLLARELRAVFRRTLGNVGSVGPAITFTAGPEVLRMRAKGFDAVVKHLPRGKLPPDKIAVPFELLAACEGRSDRLRRELAQSWKEFVDEAGDDRFAAA